MWRKRAARPKDVYFCSSPAFRLDYITWVCSNLYFIPTLPQKFSRHHLKLTPGREDLSLTSLWVTDRK